MNASRTTAVSLILSILFAAGMVCAQANASLEFYGHYASAQEAKRVATLINLGKAPGWSNAVAEEIPNAVTGTFGVYARRVAPQRPGPKHDAFMKENRLGDRFKAHATEEVVFLLRPNPVGLDFVVEVVHLI